MNTLMRYILVLAGLVMAADGVYSQTVPPSKGGTLPNFTLPAPADAAYQQYLGIQADKPFTITQIKADVVILQIFSMYCPHCQRDAPALNQFYNKIEERGLQDAIKLIGIGAGNSDFEVAFYKKTYRIGFPLFSDGDFSLHKQFGEVRTPYFIGIKLNKDGTHRVFYSKLGGISEPDAFLKMILEESNLSK